MCVCVCVCLRGLRYNDRSTVSARTVNLSKNASSFVIQFLFCSAPGRGLSVYKHVMGSWMKENFARRFCALFSLTSAGIFVQFFHLHPMTFLNY